MAKRKKRKGGKKRDRRRDKKRDRKRSSSRRKVNKRKVNKRKSSRSLRSMRIKKSSSKRKVSKRKSSKRKSSKRGRKALGGLRIKGKSDGGKSHGFKSYRRSSRSGERGKNYNGRSSKSARGFGEKREKFKPNLPSSKRGGLKRKEFKKLQRQTYKNQGPVTVQPTSTQLARGYSRNDTRIKLSAYGGKQGYFKDPVQGNKEKKLAKKWKKVAKEIGIKRPENEKDVRKMIRYVENAGGSSNKSRPRKEREIDRGSGKYEDIKAALNEDINTAEGIAKDLRNRGVEKAKPRQIPKSKSSGSGGQSSSGGTSKSQLEELLQPVTAPAPINFENPSPTKPKQETIDMRNTRLEEQLRAQLESQRAASKRELDALKLSSQNQLQEQLRAQELAYQQQLSDQGLSYQSQLDQQLALQEQDLLSRLDALKITSQEELQAQQLLSQQALASQRDSSQKALADLQLTLDSQVAGLNQQSALQQQQYEAQLGQYQTQLGDYQNQLGVLNQQSLEARRQFEASNNLLTSQLQSANAAREIAEQRVSNMANAFIPQANPITTSVAYGDQRTTSRKKKKNRLSDLSILSGLGTTSNPLAGLQLA